MSRSSEEHTIAISPNPKRVRVVLGGAIVAETTRALTLREAAHPPVHYIPREDVAMDLLERTSSITHCPYKGEASYFTVTAHGLTAKDAAWSYEAPRPDAAPVKDHIAFYPHKVDAIEELG